MTASRYPARLGVHDEIIKHAFLAGGSHDGGRHAGARGNVATTISVKTNAAAEQPGETRALAPGARLVQDETIRADQSGSA